MITFSTRTSALASRATVLAVAIAAAASSWGCESEPARNSNRRAVPNANDEMPAPGEAGSPLVLKHTKDNPIARIPSEFPGIESRLVTNSRRGTTLLVEIELVNVSAAPVTIENYSATEATLVDDALKQPVGVYDTGTGAIATTGLTRTLQPGESTTVSASFPLGAKSKLATLTFPKLGIFTAIEIDSGSKFRSKTPEEIDAEGGGGNRSGRNANRNGRS